MADQGLAAFCAAPDQPFAEPGLLADDAAGAEDGAARRRPRIRRAGSGRPRTCQRLKTHSAIECPPLDPAAPRRFGGLLTNNVREMLSVLDTWVAVLLAAVSLAYRVAGAQPDPAAMPVLSILTALALSTYAQSLFGLDFGSGMTLLPAAAAARLGDPAREGSGIPRHSGAADPAAEPVSRYRLRTGIAGKSAPLIGRDAPAAAAMAFRGRQAASGGSPAGAGERFCRIRGNAQGESGSGRGGGRISAVRLVLRAADGGYAK